MAWRTKSSVLLLIALPAMAGSLSRYERAEPHMGTLVRITLYAPGQESAESGFQAAFARISAIDSVLSDYKPESELSRLSRQPAGVPAAVSEDLWSVLSAAQAVSAQTAGAFDMTMGPLIRLWREARVEHRLPHPEAIEEARTRIGYRNVKLHPARHTVTFAATGMQLDAGGIGKGYAADEALTTLRRMGLSSALVAAAGDLAIGDPPPGRNAWTIAVEPRQGVRQVLRLSNAGVSTSGDAEQFMEVEGVRYSHIVDPKTGLGLTESLGVTVVAMSATQSDSLATGLSVMGESGLRTWKGDAAVLAAGRSGVWMSPAMKLLIDRAKRQRSVSALPGSGPQPSSGDLATRNP